MAHQYKVIKEFEHGGVIMKEGQVGPFKDAVGKKWIKAGCLELKSFDVRGDTLNLKGKKAETGKNKNPEK